MSQEDIEALIRREMAAYISGDGPGITIANLPDLKGFEEMMASGGEEAQALLDAIVARVTLAMEESRQGEVDATDR